MPNYNPSFPEVLGNEFMATRGHTHGVRHGEPARTLRLPSTTAETISSLKMSATLDPYLRAETYTVVDVIPEGAEDQPLFTGAFLAPVADVTVGNWGKDTLPYTNLWDAINEDPFIWGSSAAPAHASWLWNPTPNNVYECQFAATDFHTGGPFVNARIGWLAVEAIYGTNIGFRKLKTSIVINGVEREPSGGTIRDVHNFGATYSFQYGELNPVTLKPWLPADIAQFRSGGNSKVRIQTMESVPWHYPLVYAVALTVFYLPTENRVAAGVYKRPITVTSRLTNVTTDSLISLPSGSAGWSKPATGNFLYTWRQSVSPALMGAVNANDVRWNGVFQDLGPDGKPPGIVYPLTFSGTSPPPSTAMASQMITHDHLGRTGDVFIGDNAATYGLALVRSDAAISVDSQPYRLDASDLVAVNSTQKVGQRVVPASSQSYLGVRVMVIPPATGDPTLTVSINRVSDGVQMGGTFIITASAARALPAAFSHWAVDFAAGWRYITGFLSSGAALIAATAYEIRLSSSAGGDWLAAVLDASLGSTASFGGNTSGAFIGNTHFPDRELVATVIRQPDPPTNLVAALVDVAVATNVPDVTTVKHVSLTWTLPAVGMGSIFARYEVERQLDGGAWERIAHVNSSAIASLPNHDREVSRTYGATYRIRAVGKDGRVSNWATSNTVTPTAPGAIAILTSNHMPSLENVYVYDPESTYPILSAEGDETLRIHGSDLGVIFMEAEDRGVGWQTKITINQVTLTGRGGTDVLTELLNAIRSLSIPYVCVLDDVGSRFLGHVTVREVSRIEPHYRYTAEIDVVPTHTVPIPVEVS